MEDFLAEFCTPALLHATLDVQYTEIVPAQVPETALTKHASGSSSRNDNAFTDSIWYQLFVFMTNPRRTAHGLVNLHPTVFDRVKIVKYIAPYYDASGDDSEDDFSLTAPLHKKTRTPVEQILAHETAPDEDAGMSSAHGSDLRIEDSDPGSLGADMN